MEDRRRWIPVLTLVAGLGLMFTAQQAGAQPVDLQPPPSVVVSGSEPPAAINPATSMFAEDTAEPAFQEYFADDSSQAPASAAASTSAGAVLASDSFSNPSAGLLPSSSSRPDRFKIGYLNGEYQIASVSSGMDLSETALISSSYGDVSIAVDARVIQATSAASDETVRIYCRRQTQGSGFTGYRFQYSPLVNGWGLYRGDGDTGVSLAGVQYLSGPPFAADTHHLVLSCAGTTISASIDGAVVGSFKDGAYREGRAALGFGNFTRWDPSGIVGPGAAYPGTYDVRFRKLVLTSP